MAKLCMGCMNPLPEGSETCPVCGFTVGDSNPSRCLPVTTVLQEHYIVGRAISESSDSLQYIAYDRMLKEPCMIREFFPAALCRRENDDTVTARENCAPIFEEYREQFRQTMRSLARVKDLPVIIPVYDIFEENGTVYAVTDYCQGVSLAKKLKQSGFRLPWSEARSLFMSLLTCVAQLHSANIRHFDICPDTILIGADGKPHLRGFSIPAVHQVGGSLEPQLHTGYAAPEQYDPDATLSEATEVYALAATVFRAVTGNEPPAGNNRSRKSDDLFMPADVAEELSQQVCFALFNALQVDPEQRTRTVAELRDQLSTEPNVSALRDEADDEDIEGEDDDDEEEGGNRLGTVLIVVASVLAAGLLVVLGILYLPKLLSPTPEEPSSSEASEVTLPTLTTTTTREIKAKQYAVPLLVDKNYYEIRNNDINGDMTISVKYKKYSDKENGVILSQSPEAGTNVDKGTNISIVISCGPNDDRVIPSVAGWPEEYAKLYLEALGFRVEVVDLQASDYEAGTVDSTDPDAGTVKQIGDLITLRVSRVEQTAPIDEPTDADAEN